MCVESGMKTIIAVFNAICPRLIEFLDYIQHSMRNYDQVLYQRSCIVL